MHQHPQNHQWVNDAAKTQYVSNWLWLIVNSVKSAWFTTDNSYFINFRSR